jgi:hypothetical protein
LINSKLGKFIKREREENKLGMEAYACYRRGKLKMS